MDELTRLVARLALRMAALPPEASRNDAQALDVIEELAHRILTEIASRRVAGSYDPCETRGAWCIRS